MLDGQKRDAPSGVIQGYDASTGELKWAWDMIKPDAPAMPPMGQTYTRGTPNMWTTASGDEQLGLVYVPLGISADRLLERHPLRSREGVRDVAGRH